MRHTAGMFVTAVEQDDRAAPRAARCRPSPIKQVGPIVGLESSLFDRPHQHS
jgi:hypothetical protein